MLSSTAVSAGQRSTRGVAQARGARAQPHLSDRLAGNVDRARARIARACRGSDQERRLADAGIARHQQHRAAHKAAAGDAVQLSDARRQPRRVMRLAGERLEREQAAFAGLAAGPAALGAPDPR